MSYSVTIQPDAAIELDEVYAYVAQHLKRIHWMRRVWLIGLKMPSCRLVRCLIAHRSRVTLDLPFRV